jgi:hypothetical protein
MRYSDQYTRLLQQFGFTVTHTALAWIKATNGDTHIIIFNHKWKHRQPMNSKRLAYSILASGIGLNSLKNYLDTIANYAKYADYSI